MSTGQLFLNFVIAFGIVSNRALPIIRCSRFSIIASQEGSRKNLVQLLDNRANMPQYETSYRFMLSTCASNLDLIMAASGDTTS